ncbi:MAG: hypothetical protein IT374_00520 [Polyangiaceae bacterium]|nr:hypothetical protein [Polyangiaceae bacterium]
MSRIFINDQWPHHTREGFACRAVVAPLPDEPSVPSPAPVRLVVELRPRHV